MAVEDALAVLDALGQAPHRHGVPAPGFGEPTGERDDELLAAGTFIGVIAAALAAVTAVIAGHAVAAAAAAVAVAAQVVWLVIYLRISAPVNRALTAAARAGEVPADACSLQRRWDSVITARAILQGAAAIALCVAIAVR
ncbi:MAG: hypothetical protein WA895_31475 [Streptosporangiaceae bacterium]